ncbi:MAG: O-antigen ligase family protein [Anaerolineae bacterium]|nr:O-antigen ligase family protein [Anaerolineae bacterium]
MIEQRLPTLYGTSRLWRNREVRRNIFPALVIVLGLAVVLAGTVVIGTDIKLGAYYVAGVLGALFALWIAVRPRVGVIVLIAFVYLNLSDLLEVYFNIPSINKPLVGLIFVSALTNRVVLQRRPLIITRPQVLIFIYGMATFISILGAQYLGVAVSRFTDWVKDFAILFIIVQFSDKEDVWKHMQWVLLLCAALLAFISCYQTLTSSYEFEFFGLGKSGIHEITAGFDNARVTGPLDDPNYYAQMLLLVLPISVYRAMTERNLPLRLLAVVSSMMIMATIIFTYSRGAFLAVLLVGLLIARDRKLNPYKIAVALVVIVSILSLILPAGYLDRIMTLEDILPGSGSSGVQTEASFRGRSSEMIIAIQMFIDNPIFGVGLVNYVYRYLEYSYLLGMDNRFEAREAHSLYLEVAAETGTFGLLAFAAMLIGVYVSLNHAKRKLIAIQRQDLVPWVSGIKYGMMAYLTTSIFLHNGYPRYLWLTLAFCAGCQILADSLTRQYQQAVKQAREDQQGVYIVEERIPLSSELV